MVNWLKIIVIVLLLVVIINDVSVIAVGYFYIGDMAKRIARVAIEDYKVSNSADTAVRAAQEKALMEKVTITGFQITNNKVRLSIAAPPRRTWLAHRISSLKPYLSANALVELPIR